MISQQRLKTCRTKLQFLFNQVIKHQDCAIMCGFRDRVDQNAAFFEGKSKLKFPNSKHNHHPSFAVDVVPYPIDWKNKNRFIYFAGLVKGFAIYQNIDIRWLGDANMDSNPQGWDLGHYELIQVSMDV